jgi:hypothetical protein
MSVSAMAGAVPVTSAAVPLAAAAAVALACNLRDPAIAESSGVARAPAPAWFYTHNDSGDRARFFAVDRSCTTVGTWRLRNVAAVDWEDMAAGPGGTLWFGDIGDNRSSRDHVSLYRVDASALASGGGAVQATRVDLRYDDGPHDAETLLVHPVDGRTWVVTKSAGGDAGVYAVGDGGVLHRVASLALDVGGATGGDISPDGRRVVIRSYLAAYEWQITGGDVAGSLARPGVAVSLPVTEQGEGIAYVDDGRTLLTTAEGVGAAVRTFPTRIGDPAVSPGPTTPTRRPVRDGGDDPPWWALGAVAAVVAAVTGALVVRARRRGE